MPQYSYMAGETLIRALAAQLTNAVRHTNDFFWEVRHLQSGVVFSVAIMLFIFSSCLDCSILLLVEIGIGLNE